MKRNFNQIFFLKRSKSKVGLHQLFVCGSPSTGARTEFALHRKCDPDKWISDKGRVNGKTEDAEAFNKLSNWMQFSPGFMRYSKTLFLPEVNSTTRASKLDI